MLMTAPLTRRTGQSAPAQFSSLTHRRIYESLKNHRLFRVLSPDSLATIALQAYIQSSEKDQILFLQDEEAKFLYLVLSGHIKLFRETASGTEVILDILETGRIFGETPFLSTKKHPCSAQSATSAEFIALPYSIIDPLVMAEPLFARAMLETITSYRQIQDKEIEHRTLQSTAQRIGCFMLRLAPADIYGKQIVILPYDKTLIAARLGMQPETFSRGLARLKADTGLDVHGAKITIPDTRLLVQYCCPACCGHFPCADRRRATL